MGLKKRLVNLRGRKKFLARPFLQPPIQHSLFKALSQETLVDDFLDGIVDSGWSSVRELLQVVLLLDHVAEVAV